MTKHELQTRWKSSGLKHADFQKWVKELTGLYVSPKEISTWTTCDPEEKEDKPTKAVQVMFELFFRHVENSQQEAKNDRHEQLINEIQAILDNHKTKNT